MGQRHQMFLIARLFPKKPEDSKDNSDKRAYFRCIGAYHLQWCYGILALNKVARFLSLMKNEHNAEVIKDEIRRAQFQYGRRQQAPKMPKFPCPYTMYLLGSAVDNSVSDDVERSTLGFSFGRSALSPNMGSWDGDNNDGITVIDVTDPMNPAICFLLNGRDLLTPGEYVARYEDDSDKTVKEAIDSLKGVRLVTRDMLAEAWPSEYKSDEDEASEVEAFDLSTLAQEVPSLSNLIMGPAVEIASQSGDTSQLENLIWMPGKAELIKQALRAERPFPAESLDLLIKVLQHEAGAKSFLQLDLSSLHLSADQITTIVSNSDIVNSRPLAVNLSGNSILDPAAVSAVLSAFPNLRRLTMLDTGLNDDQLFELLSNSPKLFYGLSDLIHPALLLAPPDPKREHYLRPNVFTVVTRTQNWSVSASSVPFFNVEKILKSLIQCMHLTHVHESSFSMQSTWIPSLVLSTGVPVSREEEAQYPLVGQHWNQRTVACVPHMRSHTLLGGEGWLFVVDLTMSYMSSDSSKRYGFVKQDHEALTRAIAQAEHSDDSAKGNGDNSTSEQGSGSAQKSILADIFHIHDIREFLSELEKEGRTIPNNTEELVAAFEQALDVESRFGPRSKWTLVTHEDLPNFMPPTQLLRMQGNW